MIINAAAGARTFLSAATSEKSGAAVTRVNRRGVASLLRTGMSAPRLHPANPLAIFPNRLQGSEIAGVKDVPGGGNELPFFRVVPGVAGANGYKLQHAGV